MKRRKGLTLIEVILSIAIIGIITMPMLSIFSNGLRNIVNAGKRTEEVFGIQDKLNTEIIKLVNKSEEDIEVTDGNVIINNLTETPFTIEGKIITVTSSDESNYNIVITTFVPNKTITTN